MSGNAISQNIKRYTVVIFNACQFFITSHSPLVASDVKGCVFGIKDGQLYPQQTFGKLSADILSSAFDISTARSLYVQVLIDKAYQAIKDGDDEGDINEEYNAYLYRLTTDNGALQSTPIPTGNAVLLNVKGKGDLLVIPQEMNYTRPVLAINYTLNYGGSTTSPVWKVYPLKGNTDWTPGASLNYTFTIDEDNAYFTVSVGDWIDGNKGNEDVEFN